ncbi:transcription factor bHLH10-like [Bidens hawaiensis]|uniref:transcription factor bHLH10-like n=1 Tax=Bidens hawaiensis TaxID=980011 RepID=UPI00404B08DA
MFEASASFDPNSQTNHHHHELSNFHQILNLSNTRTPTNHFHNQHLMNMEVDDHQNHQQVNWNHIGHSSGQMYHPVQALNIHPQHPFYKELLSSLPKGFNVTGCGSGFGDDQMYHEGDEVFEFDVGIVNGKGRGTKNAKQPVSEKHRRRQMNGKFEALKSLIPYSTKVDRTSIIGDTIGYINKLKGDLEELKILVDRKRCNISRMKKQKIEEVSNLDVESNTVYDDQQAYNANSTSTTKSSWLQCKSKNVEVDVRIIDDEVTIKLVQQKRINCLLVVSQVFDELNLDVQHVAGGLIGGYYSYLFNNKICEGSSVYASDIANKLIEEVDKQYATIPVTSSY